MVFEIIINPPPPHTRISLTVKTEDFVVGANAAILALLPLIFNGEHALISQTTLASS